MVQTPHDMRCGVAVPDIAVVGAAVVEAEAHADVSESCARMSLIQSR